MTNRSTGRDEQAQQLARVSSRIERAVLAYVTALPIGAEFLGHELDRYACGQACCTPGSATRILRNLRRKGLLNYIVSNRAQARYRRLPLEDSEQVEMFFGGAA